MQSGSKPQGKEIHACHCSCTLDLFTVAANRQKVAVGEFHGFSAADRGGHCPGPDSLLSLDRWKPQTRFLSRSPFSNDLKPVE